MVYRGWHSREVMARGMQLAGVFGMCLGALVAILGLVVAIGAA